MKRTLHLTITSIILIVGLVYGIIASIESLGPRSTKNVTIQSADINYENIGYDRQNYLLITDQGNYNVFSYALDKMVFPQEASIEITPINHQVTYIQFGNDYVEVESTIKTDNNAVLSVPLVCMSTIALILTLPRLFRKYKMARFVLTFVVCSLTLSLWIYSTHYTRSTQKLIREIPNAPSL